MARFTPLVIQNLVGHAMYVRIIALLTVIAFLAGTARTTLAQLTEPDEVFAETIITDEGGPVPFDVHHGDDCAFPSFGWQFKSGPAFTLGDGFFAEKRRVGYQIAFGIREPFLPNDRRFFFDFGGSYLSAYGQERPVTVEGSIEGGVLGRRTLEDFLDLSLSELSRASGQVAFGWYFDVVDCDVCRSRFAARVGGRVSHVRGHFDEIPTADLRDEINNSIAAGENFVLEKDLPFKMTDTSPGIFGGIEFAIDRRVSRGVNVSFLVDGEFANDFVNFRGFSKQGLPTASLLLGINVSR